MITDFFFPSKLYLTQTFCHLFSSNRMLFSIFCEIQNNLLLRMYKLLLHKKVDCDLQRIKSSTKQKHKVIIKVVHSRLLKPFYDMLF